MTPLSEEEAPRKPSLQTPSKTDLRKYLVSCSFVAAVTLLNLVLQRHISPKSLDILYLIAVLATALAFGTAHSVFTAILSVLVYDFFFTEPRFSLTIHRIEDIINLMVFFAIALAVGQLIKINKRQYAALKFRLERSKLVEEVGKELLSLPAAEQFLSGVLPGAFRQDYAYQLIRIDLLDEIAQIVIRQLAEIFTEPAFVLFPSADGELRIWARSWPESRLTNEEHGAARWVLQNGEPAGSGTQTLYGIKTYFEPIKKEKKALGVVGIQMDVRDMMPEQRQLLGALTNLTSLSIARLG